MLAGILFFVVFIAFFTYAMLKAASDADDALEEYWRTHHGEES